MLLQSGSQSPSQRSICPSGSSHSVSRVEMSNVGLRSGAEISPAEGSDYVFCANIKSGMKQKFKSDVFPAS